MNARSLPWNRRITCPFCLGTIEWQKKLAACPLPRCGKELPVQYVDRDARMPPFPVQVFGWSQHGKTAYLYALTLMLMRMNNVWPCYAWSAANDTSQRKVQDINSFFRQGIMPVPTPPGADECYVMILREMEPWRSRALLLRDCDGWVFDDMHVSVEEAPFLLRARTVFMFISLHDLEGAEAAHAEGRTMDMLLNNYIETLSRSGVRLRRERRRLVVVLTKADLIRDLPPALRDYLAHDTLWAVTGSADPERTMRELRLLAPGEPASAFMTRYLSAMATADHWIQRWLEQSPAGRNFIRLAASYNVEVRFSLTSATGSPPEGGILPTTWEPRRVLDPFFWGLELERRAAERAPLRSLWAAVSARLPWSVTPQAGNVPLGHGS